MPDLEFNVMSVVFQKFWGIISLFFKFIPYILAIMYLCGGKSQSLVKSHYFSYFSIDFSGIRNSTRSFFLVTRRKERGFYAPQLDFSCG